MWGVLPVKNFENAKTRLAPALSPDERRTLFRLMVEDVLAAMCGSTLSRLPETVGNSFRSSTSSLTMPPSCMALSRTITSRSESEGARLTSICRLLPEGMARRVVAVSLYPMREKTRIICWLAGISRL